MATFGVGPRGPRGGDFVVSFSEETEGLSAARTLDLEVVERWSQRGDEIVLARASTPGAR